MKSPELKSSGEVTIEEIKRSPKDTIWRVLVNPQGEWKDWITEDILQTFDSNPSEGLRPFDQKLVQFSRKE